MYSLLVKILLLETISVLRQRSSCKTHTPTHILTLNVSEVFLFSGEWLQLGGGFVCYRHQGGDVFLFIGVIVCLAVCTRIEQNLLNQFL